MYIIVPSEVNDENMVNNILHIYLKIMCAKYSHVHYNLDSLLVAD